MRKRKFHTYRDKLLNNRIVILLITLYFIGLIFGLFINKYPIVTNNHHTKQPIKAFFNIFCLHYWYIFIIWLMGLCSIGFLIDILITFFRGFIFGVLIASLIKTSFKLFLLMVIIEGIIFVPAFIYLLYLSFVLSISNFLNVFSKKRIILQFDMKNYINCMFFITTILAIYSIILIII